MHLAERIEAIWEKSRDETARRIATVEEAVTAMLAGDLSDGLRGAAERDAHKLAGSLGMFGFPTGSELARQIEHAFRRSGGPDHADLPRLAELTLELREEFETRANGSSAGDVIEAPAPQGIALLIVSSDGALVERLWVEALARHLRPFRAASSNEARRLIAAGLPEAVLLDVSFTGEDAIDDLGLLEDLAESDPPIPVVVLSGTETLLDRVEVARRGGRAFVARTRTPWQMIDAVSETVAQLHRSNTKILAIDDDPAISATVQALLGEHGLSVSTINDSLGFWDSLEEVRPDLLVLDLDMPQLNGIDLCMAVRSDSRFGQLPIVFLTARTDAASVQRIFDAGADDYVTKPIVAPELVTRVLNRLERVTLLRQFAERDSLTGIPNRRRSTAVLEDLLAMSDRFGQPLALAAIDLDSFKGLNDRLGHAAGDSALQRLATMLVEAFRGEDVVGRWGSDEFIAGMYGMARDDGVQRLAEVLESFRAQELTGRGGATVRMTFTAGVAEYPADGSDLHELYQSADEALHAAKEAGRNRVLAAGARSAGNASNVVVVEDDKVLAEVLIDSLKTRGHRPRWIVDGQDAVAALTGPNAELRPDLVLLDVNLPGLDGLSVLRCLARDGVLIRTTVIMLTARSEESEVLEALELGAVDHVAKPFSVPVLMQRVRRALRAHGSGPS